MEWNLPAQHARRAGLGSDRDSLHHGSADRLPVHDRVADWKLVEEQIVGDFGVFSVRRKRARSPRTGAVQDFHVLDLPHSVKVIALTDDDRVVMVEQFRHGVGRVTLEFPAGLMDDGEDPVAAAMRELEEETGYRARSAERLVEFDPDPALQSNAVQVIVARGCTADGERKLDEGEDVAVRLVPLEQVDELLRAGVIRHAVAISAWHLYESLLGSRKGALERTR